MNIINNQIIRKVMAMQAHRQISYKFLINTVYLPIGISSRAGTKHSIWYPLSQASQNKRLA